MKSYREYYIECFEAEKPKFLFDAIHHRGQLSTYLRPMGGKVPSIYGPSADDPGI